MFDQIGKFFIRLVSVNHKDFRFKFRIGVEMQKFQEGKVHFLFKSTHEVNDPYLTSPHFRSIGWSILVQLHMIGFDIVG